MIGYIISLFILLAIYILVIILMERFKNIRITNITFLSVSFICYILLVLIVYKQNGLHDWNFLNTLPTANVSPFMFFIIIVYVFLPKKIKDKWSLLISLLSLGMVMAGYLDIISRIIDNYAFHIHFLLNYISHLSLSLYGIYLIRSKQIKLDIKESIKSGSLIIMVAAMMLIINIIFKTAFFGIAITDDYNIYAMKLVPTWYLSAILYFIGLLVVLIAGYYYQYLLNKYNKK